MQKLKLYMRTPANLYVICTSLFIQRVISASCIDRSIYFLGNDGNTGPNFQALDAADEADGYEEGEEEEDEDAEDKEVEPEEVEPEETKEKKSKKGSEASASSRLAKEEVVAKKGKDDKDGPPQVEPVAEAKVTDKPRKEKKTKDTPSVGEAVEETARDGPLPTGKGSSGSGEGSVENQPKDETPKQPETGAWGLHPCMNDSSNKHMCNSFCVDCELQMYKTFHPRGLYKSIV